MKEYPYWWDTAPTPVEGEPPELPSRSDVAIVGAGYTGLAAARELARRGASVVVLERERVGWGGSSRNGGQVLTGLKPEAATLVARYGEARARELFAISLDAIATLERLIADESIACEYETSGHLLAASKPSHFAAFRDEQVLLARVFHHQVDLIGPGEQDEELHSDAYHGLLRDRRSGAINPAQYVSGLAGAACRAGARLHERTPVTRIRRQGTRWDVSTGRGSIDAADILIATDGYTDGATPWLQRRLVPIGSYIIATEPLDSAQAAELMPTRRVVFDSKHFLSYFRLTRDNRLLFGGRAEFAQPTPDATRRCAEILRKTMTEVFPSLRSTRIEYAWGGQVAFTRDQLPHAGSVDEAYYAGGYCGHGIAMATYLGTMMGRRIAGEPLPRPFVDDHLPAIPLYRGTPWFLPIVGAYYKLKDLIA